VVAVGVIKPRAKFARTGHGLRLPRSTEVSCIAAAIQGRGKLGENSRSLSINLSPLELSERKKCPTPSRASRDALLDLAGLLDLLGTWSKADEEQA
jgi:hypothetical protein